MSEMFMIKGKKWWVRVLLVLITYHFSLLTSLSAPRVLPQQQAEHFCRLMVSDGEGAVYPLSVYARNLTRYLFGTTDYGPYSAQQVLTGYIFFYDDWAQEPLSSRDGFELISELHSGATLRIFPHKQQSIHNSLTSKAAEPSAQFTIHDCQWYAPTAHIPESVPAEHRRYMHDVFTRLNGEVQAGNWAVVDAYIDRMMQYQCQYGGSRQASQPSLFHIIGIFSVISISILVILCHSRIKQLLTSNSL